MRSAAILNQLTIEKMTTPQQPPNSTAVRGLGWDIDSPLASNRGEPANSTWLVIASVCTYLVGYRFYARFVAARVMALDDKGMEQNLRLVERLEELDDVQTVYTNLDLTGAEELIASMS